MNFVNARFLSVIALLLLSACGGGGGSGSDSVGTGSNGPVIPPVVNVGAVSFTKTEIQAVAGLGLLLTELTGNQTAGLLGYFGGFLQGSSLSAGGSSPAVSVSCVVDGIGGGSVTVTTSKSGTYTGLLKGDYLTGMYNNCNLGGSVLLNGRVKLTAISTMANLVAGDFATSYEADMTDFSLDGVIYSGVINATTNISNGSTNFSEAFAVTSPLGLSVNSGRITNTFGQGASFAQVDGANGAASRKLDGNVKVVANADSIPLVISTSTPLLGSTNSRRFIANSGVIAVKQNAESLATETSFSGAVASVKADSNKDGSLDFVFISTWSELITFAP